MPRRYWAWTVEPVSEVRTSVSSIFRKCWQMCCFPFVRPPSWIPSLFCLLIPSGKPKKPTSMIRTMHESNISTLRVQCVFHCAKRVRHHHPQKYQYCPRKSPWWTEAKSKWGRACNTWHSPDNHPGSHSPPSVLYTVLTARTRCIIGCKYSKAWYITLPCWKGAGKGSTLRSVLQK